MRFRVSCPFAVTLFAVTLLAASATAQSLTSVDRSDVGLKLRVFKFMKETTLPPLERQVKAKWLGKKEMTVEIQDFRRTRKEKKVVDLVLFTFNIDRTQKPRIGPTEADRLNGAVDLQDFLVRRGVINADDPRLYKVEDYKKPLKNKSRAEYKVIEVKRKGNIPARIYYSETKTEFFGLVATSNSTLQPYLEGLDKIAKSVQRVKVVAKAAAGASYENSTLPFLKRRRAVVAKLPADWQHRDTKNFLIITAIKKSAKNDKLLDAICNDLELMRGEFAKRFPPLRKIDELAVVRIFDDYADYMAYGAPKGTGGYWSPRHKELVLPNPGQRIRNPLSYRKGQNAMATLYHEAMHQYLAYANGQPPPVSWFNEGYGEYFGGAQIDRRKNVVKKITYNKTRFQMVKLQAKNDAFPPLKNMLRMNQGEFYGKFALKNYAYSWSFCYFLEQERQKPKNRRNEEWAAIPENYLKNLRAAARTGKSLDDIYKKAYQKTFGTLDMNALQDAWIKTIKTWK